jgi:type 1 fimbria pilin
VENGLTGPGAATGVGVRMSARGGGASWDLSRDWTLARPGPGEDFIDYYYTYETRYVQTASTITAGQFSATITFTVNFN